MLLLQLFALSTAFAPTRLRAAPTRLAATATEEDVRLRVTLATQTAGRSFSFDVQKQVWLYRRCPARYSVDGSGDDLDAGAVNRRVESFRVRKRNRVDGPYVENVKRRRFGNLIEFEFEA